MNCTSHKNSSIPKKKKCCFETYFIATGNANLTNKMVSYMTDQKALPKPFILLVVVLVSAAERILSRVFCSCCTTETIYRIVEQFEETGSVCHKHAKEHKCNPFIH
jgi:hypothetical protein